MYISPLEQISRLTKYFWRSNNKRSAVMYTETGKTKARLTSLNRRKMKARGNRLSSAMCGYRTARFLYRPRPPLRSDLLILYLLLFLLLCLRCGWPLLRLYRRALQESCAVGGSGPPITRTLIYLMYWTSAKYSNANKHETRKRWLRINVEWHIFKSKMGSKVRRR